MEAGPAQATLDAADYRALAQFRQALRRFLAFSEAAAVSAGLTPQQHQALLAIKGAPDGVPPGVGDLAERLFVRHHSAVELVDRLARMDLVRRGPDPADRRRVRLLLTAEAEQRLAALSAVHLEELRAIRPSIAALLALLDQTERKEEAA
jgi:DNA-binding MarR family transcriptional regulator